MLYNEPRELDGKHEKLLFVVFKFCALSFLLLPEMESCDRRHCSITIKFIIFFGAIVFINFKESSSLIIKNKDLTHMEGQINDIKVMENQIWDDKLYLGHSGYPWNSTSSVVPNGHLNVSSFNNTTPVSVNANHRTTRIKRGVVHLYNMVVCATGCNPLAYKGYGCYCGFLGSGYTIDGIDQCCKMHDWCYDATDCPMFLEYFVPYYWKCYHGYKPICAVEHGKWGGSGSCAQRLCECDRTFAECLRRFPCPTRKAMCTSSPWRLIQNVFMVV